MKTLEFKFLNWLITRKEVLKYGLIDSVELIS